MVEAMVRTIKDDAMVAAERDPNGNLNDGAGGPKDYSEGDEAMEAVYFKLEMIGFRVGERLIEKYVKRLIVLDTAHGQSQSVTNQLILPVSPVSHVS